MFEKIKEMFDSDKEEANVNKLSEEEELYIRKLEEKEELEQELSEWEEYEEEVKVLLPFEEKEKLELELDLLRVKRRIAYIKIHEKREKKGSSPELDKIQRKLTDEIKKKKEEVEEVVNIGWRLHLDYNGAKLYKDPRSEIKEKLKRQHNAKAIIKLLDQHSKLIRDIERNKKNILGNVVKENEIYVEGRLVNITDRIKRNVKELKSNYKRKVNTDYESQLEAINKELEDMRSELVEREELKI